MTHANFSKRERAAIAIATLTFIGASAIAHFVIGGFIEPHMHWATPAADQTPTPFEVTIVAHDIGGVGGMDYITVDSATRRLYVPRSTHTMVIDAVTGKTLGDIPGQKIAHGVALVPRLNRGFITDGGGGGHRQLVRRLACRSGDAGPPGP